MRSGLLLFAYCFASILEFFSKTWTQISLHNIGEEKAPVHTSQTEETSPKKGSLSIGEERKDKEMYSASKAPTSFHSSGNDLMTEHYLRIYRPFASAVLMFSPTYQDPDEYQPSNR